MLNGKAVGCAVFLLILKDTKLLILNAVTIRLATAEDFETIFHFINLLEETVFEKSAQKVLFTANIANPDVIYLLAVTENQIVGFLSCHIQNLLHHGGKVGEIQEMFVAENARSLGAGKELIDALKTMAKAKNVLQLEVTSSFKREAAHRFYERENFNFTHKKFVHLLK